MIIAARGAAAASQDLLPYRWVIGGASGVLRTSDSTTADSWTTRTSSFGTSQIYGIASNRINLYVAVGEAGKLATSPDGITWTQRTSSFGADAVRGVAYGPDGYWVAVGGAGKIATSTDGITWTQRTSGTASAFYAIEYGNGLWVGGGLSMMRTATDPTSTWTSRTSTLANGVRQNTIHYAPSQGIWVAGIDAGTTGALASSTDGLTWTARNSTFTAENTNGAFESNGSVIVMGNRTNNTAPFANDVQSSTNGTTWTNRTPANSVGGIYAAASDGSDFMIMVGENIQSTSDGTTWTDRGSSSVTSPYGACHSSGKPAIR